MEFETEEVLCALSLPSNLTTTVPSVVHLLWTLSSGPETRLLWAETLFPSQTEHVSPLFPHTTIPNQAGIPAPSVHF